MNADPQRGPGWLSRLLTPPIAAMQFLTIFPPLIRRVLSSAEMGRAVGYFPLVGALLGGLLAALDWGLSYVLPQRVSTVVVLGVSILATGALHLDGFLDACDGLFGGYTPESRLKIMRDERVGAFGLAGGVILLMCKYAALAESADRVAALILATTLSRWAMALAVVLGPYARDKGLGRAMKDHAGGRQVIQATAFALAVSWVAGGWLGSVAMALAGVIALLTARFALKRLPGLTGDLYGTISELVEVGVLLLYAVQVVK